MQGEATLIAGSGVQTDVSGRWGDYSALTVDPADDCTFWYTTEYYTAAGQAADPAGWQTRVGAFRFPRCTAPPKGSLAVTVTDCTSGLPIEAAAVATGDGYFRATDNGGRATFAAMQPSPYAVGVSAPGYGSAEGTATVAANKTASLALCLGALDCAEITKPTLTIKETEYASLGTLTFQGEMTLPAPLSPALDLLAAGVRLHLADGTGTILDVAIPGGALTVLDPVYYNEKAGWTVNKKQTVWTYINKNGVGEPGKVVKAVVKQKTPAA